MPAPKRHGRELLGGEHGTPAQHNLPLIGRNCATLRAAEGACITATARTSSGVSDIHIMLWFAILRLELDDLTVPELFHAGLAQHIQEVMQYRVAILYTLITWS
jgi:hypothetical protein